MIDILKHKVAHKCPSCGGNIQFTLGQLSNQKTIKCNSCNTNIKLEDSNGKSKSELKKVNKAFKDLDKTLKNFGK